MLTRASDIRYAAAANEDTPCAAGIALYMAGIALERGWYEAHSAAAGSLHGIANDPKAVVALLSQVLFLSLSPSLTLSISHSLTLTQAPFLGGVTPTLFLSLLLTVTHSPTHSLTLSLRRRSSEVCGGGGRCSGFARSARRPLLAR